MKAVRDLHNITDQGLCFFRQPRNLLENYTTLLTKDSVPSGNQESCQKLWLSFIVLYLCMSSFIDNHRKCRQVTWIQKWIQQYVEWTR